MRTPTPDGDVTSLKRAAGLAAAGVLFFATLALASDVPYVPTPQAVVDTMLEVGKVRPGDYLIDLGSGDGRIVVTAARKHGARGFGVDLNPERIREAEANAREAGVTDRVAFYQRNLFETDLSQATVITMYLLPRVNMKLRPKLLELAPGTRIVSHDFDMEDWKPDRHVVVDASEKYGEAGGQSDVYLWVVPARVDGTWTWRSTVQGKPRGYRVDFRQKFQFFQGTARVGGREVKFTDGRLDGARITFTFTAPLDGEPVKHAFEGRVLEGRITGTVQVSGPRVQGRLEWVAQRAAPAKSAAPVPARVAVLH